MVRLFRSKMRSPGSLQVGKAHGSTAGVMGIYPRMRIQRARNCTARRRMSRMKKKLEENSRALFAVYALPVNYHHIIDSNYFDFKAHKVSYYSTIQKNKTALQKGGCPIKILPSISEFTSYFTAHRPPPTAISCVANKSDYSCHVDTAFQSALRNKKMRNEKRKTKNEKGLRVESPKPDRDSHSGVSLCGPLDDRASIKDWVE